MSSTSTAAEARRAGIETRRVALLSLAMVGMSGLLWWLAPIPDTPPATLGNLQVAWPVVALALAALEFKVVHLHYRRDAHTFTLSEMGLVVGLFLVDPVSLVAARLLGGGAVLIARERQHPTKLVFNLSSYLLETVVVIALYAWFAASTTDISSLSALGALGAAIAGGLVSMLLVFVVISLVQGSLRLEAVSETLGIGTMITVGNTTLALIGVTLLSRAPELLWLLPVPVGVLYIAYSGYVRQHRERTRMRFVYETSIGIHSASSLEEAVLAFVTRIREVFNAQSAELRVTPQSSVGAFRGWVHADGQEGIDAVDPNQPEEFVDTVDAVDTRRRMVAQMQIDGAVVGVCAVGRPLTDVDEYAAEDVELFEALVAHASVAFANSRLEQQLRRLEQLSEQLRHQALHDSLTGLANRALLRDRVQHALAAAARDADDVALLFLDLDDFKTVNDSLGHAVGDELLVTLARRLSRHVRPGDTIARLGGDEFAILLPHAPSAPALDEIIGRLLEAIQEPVDVSGHRLQPGTSIGVARSTYGQTDPDQLLRDADLAMYEAKLEGKGRACVFAPSMRAAADRRLELKTGLRSALAAGDVLPHFQPIVDVQQGDIIGVEALARWRHPVRGLLPAVDFIPLAEETGLSSEIGRAMRRESFAAFRRWLDQSADLKLFLNFSADEFRQPSLADELAEEARQHGVPTSQVVIELTETAWIRDPQAVAGQLGQAAVHGFGVAIDDFGTGYSSLRYLHDFPVNLLKIPKEFVARIDAEDPDIGLASAVIDLGHSLGMNVICEGVERHEQLLELRRLGCDLGQGYLFSKPVPSVEIDALLRLEGLAADALTELGA